MPRTRAIQTTVLAVTGALVLGPAVSAQASGGSGCVRVAGGCYPTVQAAVDAAHDGDTVRIPAGRFAGGVTVNKSINLVGAGASRTHLVGGDHVLTIGEWMAPTEPTVRISGLMLRGGRAHSSPESVDFASKPGVIAGGGGLEIPAGESFVGATVTVSDTVITDNRAVPVDTLLPTPQQEQFWPHCPDGFCVFAEAAGGGIESWGNLTLVRTTVSNNFSGGPLTSDADGAGIYSWRDLTVRSSRIVGNRAAAVAPHGRFAEGGGVFMSDQTHLVMTGTSVSDNVASLVSTNPLVNPDGSTTDSLANSGGVHVNDGSTVRIAGSHIDRNAAVVDNPQGQAVVINAGLQLTISDLNLSNTTVNGNRAVARVKDIGDFGPLGGVLQWCNLATVNGLRVVGNSTVVRSVDGDSGSSAAIFAGATMCNGFDPGPSTLTNSVVKDNTSIAIGHGGRADVFGAGLITASSLTMRNVTVTGNRGYAAGSAGGDVQGGGIWNGAFPLPFLEGLHSNLTLAHSRVTGNVLAGANAEVLAGGGIYTRDHITRAQTTVSGNRPDQCFGCSTATSMAATALTRSKAVTSRRSDTSTLLDHLAAR
jgi:hypothetical protein